MKNTLDFFVFAVALAAVALLSHTRAIADDDPCAVEDSYECIRHLAEAGDAYNQYQLGLTYHFGKYGVAVNDREAVRWYRLAAEQGNAKAQNNLGASYWNGDGVIEDARESYIWYSIAKANGSKNAAKYLRLNPYHQYLTAAEIKSAKREAARRLAAIDARKADANKAAGRNPD